MGGAGIVKFLVVLLRGVILCGCSDFDRAKRMERAGDFEGAIKMYLKCLDGKGRRWGDF